MNRRAFLATVIGVTGTAKTATAAGFHVTGPLTATETERSEGYFQLGKEIMIALRPGTEPHRLAEQMLNREVQFSLFVP